MNEPNVNCGLWVMIMCPCRFIDCASDEGVTVGGDCDCVCVGGAGVVYAKSLYFPVSFAVNPKLL